MFTSLTCPIHECPIFTNFLFTILVHILARISNNWFQMVYYIFRYAAIQSVSLFFIPIQTFLWQIQSQLHVRTILQRVVTYLSSNFCVLIVFSTIALYMLRFLVVSVRIWSSVLAATVLLPLSTSLKDTCLAWTTRRVVKEDWVGSWVGRFATVVDVLLTKIFWLHVVGAVAVFCWVWLTAAVFWAGAVLLLLDVFERNDTWEALRMILLLPCSVTGK